MRDRKTKPCDFAQRENARAEYERDRLLKVAQVDALVKIGVPVTVACDQAKLPRADYYRRGGSKKKVRSPAKESDPAIATPEGATSQYDASGEPDAAGSGKAA